MRSVLIRRFELSDQLTHLFNALFWAVLAATGILIGSASRANVEPTHLSIGVHKNPRGNLRLNDMDHP